VVERGHRLGYSILPTFFDRTTRETIVQLQALVETFRGHVWPPIPQDTHAREAPAFGKSLWEYCSKSPAVMGYGTICPANRLVAGYASTLKRTVEVICE
jgi:cellulose biosynthesis protein BcsQ